MRFKERTLPAKDAAAYVSAAACRPTRARYEARVTVQAPASELAGRRWLGELTALDEHPSEVRTSDDNLDWLAMRIAMISAPYEVHEPPELIERLRVMARGITGPPHPELISTVGVPPDATARRGQEDAQRHILPNPKEPQMRSIRTLVAGLAVLGAVAVAPAAANATVTATLNDDIGYKKHMETTATEYTGGGLVVNNYLKNDNWFYGMRPQTLVVSVDSAGHMIWVSKVLQSATVCGVLDPSCASQRRETLTDGAPGVIGQNTDHLDIYHADSPNYRNLRNDLIDVIKGGTDVAQAIKDAWTQLNKA